MVFRRLLDCMGLAVLCIVGDEPADVTRNHAVLLGLLGSWRRRTTSLSRMPIVGGCCPPPSRLCPSGWAGAVHMQVIMML